MLIILALSVVYLVRSTVGCPPAEDIAPNCDCRFFGGEYMMVCRGLLSPEDLIPPMRSLAMGNFKIFSLQIEDSSLQYIPHGLFEGTSIEKIRFYRSEIMSLSESDIAFGGLEDTLTEIRATEAEYIASWDWQQLKNLKKMELIDVNQIAMGAVDEPFPRLPSLSALGITKAALTHLADGAFAELPGLRILTLKDNKIAELKKNMLPDPADRLAIIDLSNNLLSSLPDHFFYSIPNIQSLHLDNNQFVTLPAFTFSFGLQQMTEFTMTGNPLRCDCRIRWLADHRTPNQFDAVCSTPESMKGRSLIHLNVRDLWC